MAEMNEIALISAILITFSEIGFVFFENLLKSVS